MSCNSSTKSIGSGRLCCDSLSGVHTRGGILLFEHSL